MTKELVALLSAHRPADAAEATSLQETLEFIEQTPRPTARETLSGHITASAWILSPERDAALLTHHRKLDRWFQLGGHVEAEDVSIQAAATREASEESGLGEVQLLSPALFDVDAHAIPARGDIPRHIHYDLRFLFLAPHRTFAISAESLALAWVPLVTIQSATHEASLVRMAEKTSSL
jgi:8-oxo-dGTP pyrophosphatase MutT (NUDIX family)